jgi:hypothetical protein
MYIETRPEAIEAIHKSIDHWNNICVGCEDFHGSGKCSLCQKYDDDIDTCAGCPLLLSGNHCYSASSTYKRFIMARNNSPSHFCSENSANAAEAMLEALVQLLPPEERRRYEP